jgi:hypothetical protein
VLGEGDHENLLVSLPLFLHFFIPPLSALSCVTYGFTLCLDE